AVREFGDDFHGLASLDTLPSAPRLRTRGRRSVNIAPFDVIGNSDREAGRVSARSFPLRSRTVVETRSPMCTDPSRPMRCRPQLSKLAEGARLGASTERWRRERAGGNP